MSRLNVIVYLLLVCFVTCIKPTKIECVEPHEAVNAICMVDDIVDSPWNDGGQVAAPLPIWVRGEIYIDQNVVNRTQQFLMKLTWKQKAYILRRFVEGYYTEIKPANSITGHKKIFQVSRSRIQVADDEWVFFTYSHFGDVTSERILPGTSYSVSIHSLPMYSYSKGHQNPARLTHVTAPPCPSEEELGGFEMSVCSYTTDSDDYYPYDDYAEMSGRPVEKKEEEPTNNIVCLLVMSVFLILFVGLLAVITYKRSDEIRRLICSNEDGYIPATSQTNSPCGGSGGIVILVPTFGVEGRPPVWELTQTLATYLHKNSSDDVTCNLWHLTTPAPDKWLSDVIAGHRSRDLQSHVLMVRSGGNHSSGTDAYQIFDEKLKKFHSHSVIHFGDDATTTTSSYRLPRDVTKLMCALTNGSCTADDVIISELEKLATKVEMTSQQQQQV